MGAVGNLVFDIDDITTIQATEEWTRILDTLAINMFVNY